MSGTNDAATHEVGDDEWFPKSPRTHSAAVSVAAAVGRTRRPAPRTPVEAAHLLVASDAGGVSVTAPWPWLVAAPARITGVLEFAHDVTRDELEAVRRAYKDAGVCGDVEIRRALPPLPWRKRVARWRPM